MARAPRSDVHAEKPPVSTIVHRSSALAGHELAVPVVVVAVVVWLVAWLVAGRPDWLLDAFVIAAGSTTVVMVFVLQHAQERLEQATQLKLDELLRALPNADDGLIKAEAAPDGELEERSQRNLHRRDEFRGSWRS